MQNAPLEHLEIPEKTPDEVSYNLIKLIEAGFIDATHLPSGKFNYRGILWNGHDFLDTVRDPEIWRKTKEGVANAGGFSFELLKGLAKGLIKKQLERLTGVTLDL